jgi:hypothetical protein
MGSGPPFRDHLFQQITDCAGYGTAILDLIRRDHSKVDQGLDNIWVNFNWNHSSA